jgi:DNA-directed RNA polymerase subunit RPC12/RpoP
VDHLLDYRIERVEVSIDGGDWDRADNPPDWEYDLNTLSLSDGMHVLEVRVLLDTGVEQTMSVSFRVSNTVEEDNTGLIVGIVIFLVVAIGIVLFFFLLFGKKKSRAQELLRPMPPPGPGPGLPGMVPPGGLPRPPQKSSLPSPQAPPAPTGGGLEPEPPKEEGPKMIRIKCPSCKKVFKVEDNGERPLMMTCTHCGAKGSISQVPGDENKDEEEEEEEKPEPVSIICPSCGGMFELDHVMVEATCPFCNVKGDLDDDTKARLEERFGVEAEVREITVKCPSCQGKFSVKSTDREIICPYCGVSGNV